MLWLEGEKHHRNIKNKLNALKKKLSIQSALSSKNIFLWSFKVSMTAQKKIFLSLLLQVHHHDAENRI